MSKIVYGKRDTATVVDIRKAPRSLQAVWDKANTLGVNIVRVRAVQDRYEKTVGDTFFGFHKAKVSVYQQRSNPSRPLHFVRPTPLGKDNKGMQILEVADNVDVQDTLDVINDYEVYTTSSLLQRMFLSFRRLFA
jgi:hypothetical protein|tara:strand:+ start:222 stop:626 length:405 start_codon:yes stop_codon:yes gene_type:complete